MGIPSICGLTAPLTMPGLTWYLSLMLRGTPQWPPAPRSRQPVWGRDQVLGAVFLKGKALSLFFWVETGLNAEL